MVGKKSLLIVLVLTLGVMAMPVVAAVVFSESFETYAPGETSIDDPCANINNWADWTAPITNEGSATVGVSGTFTPAQGLSVDVILGLLPGFSTTTHPGFAGPILGTEASAAPLTIWDPNHDTATLDFDWALATASGQSGGPAGVQLVDSTDGKYVGWNTYSGGSWLDTSDAGSSGNYADPVGYFTDRQHVQLAIDFEARTITATTSSDTLLYFGDGFPYPDGGGSSITSAPLPLPTGFMPDTIVLWNGGYDMNVSQIYGPGFDNILLDGELDMTAVKTLTMKVEPAGIGIDTVLPAIGDHIALGLVSINAMAYINCPAVYAFDHWEGDVLNPNSAGTVVSMDTDKTVTAVFVDNRQCGDQCHDILFGDYNEDCIINLYDFAYFANNWLVSTQPE